MQKRNVVVVVVLIALAFASIISRRRDTAQQAFQSFAVHFAQEDYSSAASHIDAALKNSPEDAYYLGAKALFVVRIVEAKICPQGCVNGIRFLSDEETQQIRVAIDLYHQAIAISPSDGSFHHNLGRLHSFLQETELATKFLQRAVTLNPDTSVFHWSLAQQLESLGRTDEAFSEYRAAIELSPSIVESAAFLDLQNRHASKADEMVSEVILLLQEPARGGDPIAKSKLSKFYMWQGRSHESHRMLLEVTNDLPTLSRPWLYLGDYYRGTQQWRQMLLCYQRAGFLDTDDFVPWARMGDYFYESGQLTHAIPILQRALFAWLNQPSTHAQRAARMYRTRHVVRDDVIPKGLLSYCAPRFSGATVNERLAKFHADIGDKHTARYFEDLRVRIARVDN